MYKISKEDFNNRILEDLIDLLNSDTKTVKESFSRIHYMYSNQSYLNLLIMRKIWRSGYNGARQTDLVQSLKHKYAAKRVSHLILTLKKANIIQELYSRIFLTSLGKSIYLYSYEIIKDDFGLSTLSEELIKYPQMSFIDIKWILEFTSMARKIKDKSKTPALDIMNLIKNTKDPSLHYVASKLESLLSSDGSIENNERLLKIGSLNFVRIFQKRHSLISRLMNNESNKKDLEEQIRGADNEFHEAVMHFVPKMKIEYHAIKVKYEDLFYMVSILPDWIFKPEDLIDTSISIVHIREGVYKSSQCLKVSDEDFPYFDLQFTSKNKEAKHD
jgi:hypothetical protein